VKLKIVQVLSLDQVPVEGELKLLVTFFAFEKSNGKTFGIAWVYFLK